MELRALRLGVLLGAAALVVAAGSWWFVTRREPAGGGATTTVRRVVPAGTRIRVEVLNGTTVRGLARRATLYLRDLGFDVVKFTGDDARRDTTLVIDRTGHPDWAGLASQAFGGAPIQSRPDSAGFVDLTILLGASWRPPPQTLNP